MADQPGVRPLPSPLDGQIRADHPAAAMKTVTGEATLFLRCLPIQGRQKSRILRLLELILCDDVIEARRSTHPVMVWLAQWRSITGCPRESLILFRFSQQVSGLLAVVFREIRMTVEGAGRSDQLAEIPAGNLLGNQHLNGRAFQSCILGLLMPRFLRVNLSGGLTRRKHKHQRDTGKTCCTYKGSLHKSTPNCQPYSSLFAG